MPDATEDFRDIPAASEKDDIHLEGLKRFEDINTREQWSRRLGVEELIFTDQDGGQWDNFQSYGFYADSNGQRGDDEPPPPRYQNDKISPVIEEAVSDQRQAQIDIKVRPMSSEAKPLADTYNGIIKNIEAVSGAQDSYDCAYDEVQRSGYGGWRVVTEYADNSFDQRIGIAPIRCATGSLFFGPSEKYTKEDALYAFHVWNMDMEEFKAQYPNATTTEWPDTVRERIAGTSAAAWFDFKNNLIQLAEYWRKKPIEKDIAQLIDGRVVDADQLPIVQPLDPKILQIAAERGVQIQAAPESTPEAPLMIVPVAMNRATGQEMIRTVKSYEVERYVMNGSEVIKGPDKWAGKYIPLVPCYGVVANILGQEIVRGRVRKGKDAQRAYNYCYSQAIEVAANSPKDFFWMTPTMAEGENIQERLQRINQDQNPINFYNHDPDVPQGPIKAPGPVVQEALLSIMAKSEQDIFTSIGGGRSMEDATAGDQRSGEAVKEQRIDQEKGDSIYFANYIKSREYTGKILVDLIPRVMTTEQQVRIMQPDGTTDFVTVNQVDIDRGSAEKQTVMDLSQADFDVTVDVGPAFASQRQAAAERLTTLATESPVFAQNASDLIAKNLDIPGSTELYERIRKEMIRSGIAQGTPEELEELGITQEQQIAAQLEPQIREQVAGEVNMQLLMAQARELDARALNAQSAATQKDVEASIKMQGSILDNIKKFEESENLKLDGVLKAVEAQKQLTESAIAKLESFGSLNVSDIDNLNSASDLVEEQQQEVSPGPNSQQVLEFDPATRRFN